jgi:hypothetical protein
MDGSIFREVLANNAKDATEATIHASDEQKGRPFEQHSQSFAQWVFALYRNGKLKKQGELEYLARSGARRSWNDCHWRNRRYLRTSPSI